MFTPRLSDAGMQGNKWWYSSGNPFYLVGYGLPNCTCYAYGRAGEICGAFQDLPTGDGGTWYPAAATKFERGDTPELGAIVCFASLSGGYAGHVAVVEQIYNDSIVTSNSAWNGNYFWTETLYKSNSYLAGWMTKSRDYYLQGFIYIDGTAPGPGPDPGPGPGPVPSATNFRYWYALRPF